MKSTDSFSWLEEVEGERALRWVQAHNLRTMQQLTRDPRYARYVQASLDVHLDRNRIPGDNGYQTWHYGAWIYTLLQDESHPRGLWRRTSVQSYLTPAPQWEPLLDVDEVARAEGKSWVFFPAVQFLPPDGRRVILTLSDGGSRASVAWREFDIARRVFAEDGFHLPPAKASFMTWKDENTVFVSTDFGTGTVTNVGYPRVIKEWSRGRRLSQAPEIFRTQTENTRVFWRSYDEETERHSFVIWELDAVQGKTGEDKVWKLGPDRRLERLPLPPRAGIVALHKGEWVLDLKEDWTIGRSVWKHGSVVSLPDSELTRSVPTVRLVMERSQPREGFWLMHGYRSGLLAYGSWNARGRLWRLTFERDAWKRGEVSLPDHGRIMFTAAPADATLDTAFVRYESFLDPITIYSVDIAANHAQPVKSQPAQFDARGLMTEQFEAVSQDGTRVPYFITRPKALKFDRRTPTLLYAYGASGGREYPNYSGTRGRLWLTQGGAYVVANVRGGAEFGPEWHVTKTQRQRTYDDFVAVARDLVRRKITSPRHLGIHGFSSGGLLMGVMITRHPDLFNAAVLEVPALDLFRMDLTFYGHASTEYGSPSVPEERAFLERTSPFQNLDKRDRFPVPLIVSSTKDDTVHPGQPRRFAAKMETLGMPFFYYEAPEGGHTPWSTPQQHAQYDALFFTYLAQRLMD